MVQLQLKMGTRREGHNEILYLETYVTDGLMSILLVLRGFFLQPDTQ